MSWTNVDNKHKKKFDSNFVSCEEAYERQYIIQIIMEEFPHVTKQKIEAAVEHCCKAIRPPRGRKAFLDCLANQLK